MTIKRLSFLFLLLTLPPCYAADIARSVRDGGKTYEQTGGFFELGLTLGSFNTPFVGHSTHDQDISAELTAGGEFRKNNFFMEASQGSQDGFNLGYTLWQNNRWAIDVLGASISGSISDREDKHITSSDDEAARNSKLEDHDTFYVGAGVRLTRNFENYVVQYRLVSDIFDGNGMVSTLRAGRGWQIQNWNVHGILSAQYTSDKTSNYWFGIDEMEATNRYPNYTANSSIIYSALLGATKPLSEKFVFRAYLGYAQLPSEVRDSPLVDDHDFSMVAATLNYVFF